MDIPNIQIIPLIQQGMPVEEVAEALGHSVEAVEGAVRYMQHLMEQAAPTNPTFEEAADEVTRFAILEMRRLAAFADSPTIQRKAKRRLAEIGYLK